MKAGKTADEWLSPAVRLTLRGEQHRWLSHGSVAMLFATTSRRLEVKLERGSGKGRCKVAFLHGPGLAYSSACSYEQHLQSRRKEGKVRCRPSSSFLEAAILLNY